MGAMRVMRRRGDGCARAHARRRGCRRRASSRVEDAQRASEGWCDLNVYRIVRAVHGALARARARARGPIRARARGGWKTPIRGKTPKFGFFSLLVARARLIDDDGVLTMMV